MISLKKCDVSEYLRESAFYHTLEEDEEFSLHSEHFKQDSSIHSYEELNHLLTTLRFWGATEIPTEVLRYVVDNPVSKYEAIFKLYWDELTFLKEIVQVMSMPLKKRLNAALEVSNLPMVEILLSSGCSFDRASSRIAAERGDVTLLARILNQSNSRLYNDDVCLAAARSGNVLCLKYLFEFIRPCMAVKLSACKEAALQGHIECLTYATGECGRGVEDYLHEACQSGRLECVTCVYQAKGAWERNSGMSIVQSGSLECVRYAKANGCAFSRLEMNEAVVQGHLSIIRQLHEHSVEFIAENVVTAARNGHLECLRYMHEAGCEWGASTCTAAAESGHIDCITYARENGCEWDNSTAIYAAKNGQVECLKYLLENGCPWDATACACAAYCNQLPALQFLHENGCEWDVRTTDAAAQRKNKECLNYARAHGCPVSVRNSLWLGLGDLVSGSFAPAVFGALEDFAFQTATEWKLYKMVVSNGAANAKRN